MFMEEKILKYLTHLSNIIGASANTISAYRRDLFQFKCFLDKSARSGVLSPNSIRDFGAYLFRLGRARSSVQRKLSAIRGFCTFLCSTGDIDAVIPTRIIFPRKEKRLPRFIDQKKLNLLIESLPTDTELRLRSRLIIELLYGCGLRVSELASLKMQDYDPSSSLIRVLGKGKKERLIPIGRPAIKSLENYKNERGKTALKRKRIVDKNRLIINAKNILPLTRA